MNKYHGIRTCTNRHLPNGEDQDFCFILSTDDGTYGQLLTIEVDGRFEATIKTVDEAGLANFINSLTYLYTESDFNTNRLLFPDLKTK